MAFIAATLVFVFVIIALLAAVLGGIGLLMSKVFWTTVVVTILATAVTVAIGTAAEKALK